MRRELFAIALVAAACAGGDPARSTPDPRAIDAAVLSTAVGVDASPKAILPSLGGRFAPSEVAVEGGADVDGQWLSDVSSCDGCHADVVAMWRTSAHAFASFNNPVYRVSVDRFRAEAGNEKSRFCGGCHDPSLLVAGAMDRDVEPGDWRAHAGVTCKTCHSITSARIDGNGSYVLTSAPIPIPKPGDASSVRAHKERVKPLREGVELCASCHRAYLGEPTGNAAFFPGTDDVTPWRRSAFAGSGLGRIDGGVPRKDCRGCHMERERATLGDVSAKNGTIASHRFMGGHTWLAAMQGDQDQLARARGMLERSAWIDIAVAIDARGARTLPADGAKVTPGERITFDVVVKNVGVGHRFPGGTLDAQDTFIEVEIADKSGAVIASHGGDDAHSLRAVVADDQGEPRFQRDVHAFRVTVHNHTILPRDAAVVSYAFDVPSDLRAEAMPLRVRARLRHRSRNLALQAATCADSKTERGRAFRGRTPLDPCPPQPITEIALGEAWIGEGGEGRARVDVAAWQRLLEHGQGMMHAVQERVGEARPSLERALELLGDDGDALSRAEVLAALGALSGHEGRTDEALDELGRAASLAPDAAAIDNLRGTALAESWRWREAIAPLRAAAGAAPLDDGAASRLAIALFSGGDDGGALGAAWAGLAMSPRDPDLLRVQALALEAASARPSDVDAARAAYETYRVPDDASKIKTACSRRAPGCALERVPVHTHVMVSR